MKKMKKIVFILSSVQDSHCKNRIEEFIEYGHSVDIYAFTRKGFQLKKYNYSVNIIGEISNAKYLNRIPLYCKKIKEIIRNYNPNDTVLYLFGFDMALALLLATRRYKYIYEEADLTYTYLKNSFVRNCLKAIDKFLITKSYKTVFTSDGFVQFHYNGKVPDNVYVLPNKLNKNVESVTLLPHKEFDKEHLIIGFVGSPRFKSIYNFISVFCKTYPQYEFHVFGGPISEKFETLKKYSNCYLHGFFQNPHDLPTIYSKIDMVLSTYDAEFENVRYAEPNKLYEAIYFETPIIVSSGTFLAEKVEKLKIGFNINAMNSEQIVKFVDSLTKNVIQEKITALKEISKQEAIINNIDFIKSIYL